MRTKSSEDTEGGNGGGDDMLGKVCMYLYNCTLSCVIVHDVTFEHSVVYFAAICQQGENDIEQLCLVIRVLGTPNEKTWPVSSSQPAHDNTAVVMIIRIVITIIYI